MSEPEQYQPDQHDSSAASPAAAPDSSSSSSQPKPTSQPQAAEQPQYGQYATTAYGAMDSQFPPNYDPYLFGRPEPSASEQQASTPQQGFGTQQFPMGTNAQGSSQQSYRPMQQPQGQPASQQPSNSRYPRYVNGIDLEDPNQNAFYGRWDSGAIIAFLFALLLPVPIFPAILGWLSMRRIRILRMKGYGLALAAVIINVLYTIAFFWLMMNGVSMNDVTNRMLDNLMSTFRQQGGSGINA